MKGIKEFFVNLFEGKPRLKIEIQKLYYINVQSKDKYAIILEPVQYPSVFELMVGIQNLGRRRTSIKDVRLEINGQFLPCVNQSGVEFKPDEFKQLLWVFPANLQQGVKHGRFSLTITDTSGNAFIREGRFPVGTKVEPKLRESI